MFTGVGICVDISIGYGQRLKDIGMDINIGNGMGLGMGMSIGIEVGKVMDMG